MSSSDAQALPPPGTNQAYFDVSGLEAGTLDIPDELFITNAAPGAISNIPALSFLLIHSNRKDKFLFDLGIRRDWENLPPSSVEWIKSTYKAKVDQDVVQSLSKGNLDPDDIHYIILSHCHWDHTGDTSLFCTSTFLVGKDSESLIHPGYPENPKGRFASNLLPKDRTKYLDPQNWAPIGPFPRGYDFYGDGSLYIIDAPGHLPGHINALVRTSSDGGWIYLAGDSAHYWSQITGESGISVGAPWNPLFCMHVDKGQAEENIERIRILWKMPRVRIMLAHDAPWYNDNRGGSAFWPGKIPSL